MNRFACYLCLYWDPLEATRAPDLTGRCQRNPPIVLNEEEHGWPTTRGTGRCGEFHEVPSPIIKN